MQYNTMQFNTIQYNTIQYNTIQYNTIQYNTIQYNTIQYNTIQYNTIQRTNSAIYLRNWQIGVSVTLSLIAIAPPITGLQNFLIYLGYYFSLPPPHPGRIPMLHSRTPNTL